MRQEDTHEYDEGTVVWDDHEFVVHYERWEWDELHAYGDTTAYQRVCESDPIEYHLDGVVMTAKRLVELWGKKLFDERVAAAMV